jgi:hypothetical protein
MLAFSRKKRIRIEGVREQACPDEPQNGLRNLAEGLKKLPPTSIPQFTRPTAEKAPNQPLNVVIKIP